MHAGCMLDKIFMEAQGYQLMENTVYQYNKSAILLEKTGKSSSSKQTKHINIRFLFITDCISNTELNVEWCPTNEMIGYFMTKPTQGSLFKKFRNLIMVIIPVKMDIQENENKKKSKLIFGPWNQDV